MNASIRSTALRWLLSGECSYVKHTRAPILLDLADRHDRSGMLMRPAGTTARPSVSPLTSRIEHICALLVQHQRLYEACMTTGRIITHYLPTPVRN
jgi:hypothetical protein